MEAEFHTYKSVKEIHLHAASFYTTPMDDLGLQTSRSQRLLTVLKYMEILWVGI